MKKHARRIFIAALLALGVVATASAQSRTYNATFDLTHDVLWAGNVLEPGHYTLWLQSELSGSPFVHLSGPSGEIVVLAGTHDYGHSTAASQMKLVESDGAWFVSELDTGDNAKSFTFRVPKPKHAEMASKRNAAPREAVVSISSAE